MLKIEIEVNFQSYDDDEVSDLLSTIRHAIKYADGVDSYSIVVLERDSQ